MTFLYIIAILFSIILVHELGHFVFAKLFGVRVIEFGIGFPPRLFKFKIGETIYSLNLILIGAFVKLPGREDISPSGFFTKSAWRRAFIGFSGPLFNFIFAFLLFFVSFLFPMEVVVGGEGVKVVKVVPDSPAYISGMKEGDVILRVAGEDIKDIKELKEVVGRNLGKEVFVVVRRDGEEVGLWLTPRENPPKGQGPMGIVITWEKVYKKVVKYGVWEAFIKGGELIGRTPWMLKDFIFYAFREPEKAFVGPVGVAHIAYEASKQGLGTFLFLMGSLSFGLGFFNLFPIPPLDGGGIAVSIFEGIRRRRISKDMEMMIYTFGTILLLAFIILITYNDILRLIRGEGFLP